jgi:hypothetical protein
LALNSHAQDSPGNVPSAATNSVGLRDDSQQANGPNAVVTIDPNQLMLLAVHQSVWGPAMTYKVHQQTQSFGQNVVVSGEYKTAGGGSGQFRYSARVSCGETITDLLQVSDGRLMYTQVGKDSHKRVDIDQIRNALGNAIHQAVHRPETSLYLAIGGQPELLRNLYHRYRWYKAVVKKINGVDVWQLVGKLRTNPPSIAGNTDLDTQSMAPLAPESNVPTEVILTLGRSASLPYFPYQVDYLRRVTHKDGTPSTLELVSRVSHSDPIPTTISDKDFLFKVQDSVEQIDNETPLYRPRSRSTELTPVSIK